jgi:hypothetical protein
MVKTTTFPRLKHGGKTCQSPSLIAEHCPCTVTYFTTSTCSLPPFSVCTFDLLPKSDDVVTFYQIYLHIPKHFLFTSPSSKPLFMYLSHVPSCLGAISLKINFRPYLCFYHTLPLVFITFSLPPSATETTFTLPQFGPS